MNYVAGSSEIGAFVHLADENTRPGPGTGDDVLAGVQVGVKDLFRVDGMPTRAGSALPAQVFDGAESQVVSALRDRGARIVGKTAMDEFAYCEPPATRNPRDLRRTPGGSSGGSAAAVAAGMCPLAIGSQTLQSTIVPASYCGVFGYKPTFGRARFDGIALAPSLDTIGLLTADIEMLARAASALIPNWRTMGPLPPPVVGIPSPWGQARRHTDGWRAFDRHVDRLRKAGFELRRVDVPWNDDLTHWSTLIGDLVHGEMAHVHASWYSEFSHLYRPRTRAAIERGRLVNASRIDQCRSRAHELHDALSQLAESAGIDCWVCPSTGSVAPLGYESTGDSWMTSFWSYVGWPAATVPSFDGPAGLPYGLQIIAPRDRDERLIAYARVLGIAIQPGVRSGTDT